MFSKYITFIFIPKHTEKVKKTQLSVGTLAVISLIALVFIVGWIYLVYDYVSIRARLINLDQNLAQYNVQQQKIDAYRSQHGNTETHYAHLEALYNKLKRLTSITAADEQDNLQKDSEELKLALKTAREKGILQIIASDISEIDTDQKLQSDRFHKLVQFFQENASPLTKIPRGWPLKGYIISGFGVLVDSFTGQLRPRHGVLIATRAFTPLYATADGVVRFAGEDPYYGHVILIDHTNGIVSRYGYVSSIRVKEGEIVRSGAQIAEIHNTQQTTGPQLYYEVSINGIPQNPIKFINPLALKD